MIVKALQSGADEVVLDLEDAVPPSDKALARELLDSFPWDDYEVLPLLAVRVNAPRSPWCHRDVESVVAASIPASSIVVPKVESAGDLCFLDRLLDGVEHAHEAETPLEVQALIETAAGLTHLHDITASSVRLTSLIIGYADLAASLGRGPDFAPDLWLVAQDTIVTYARAAGIDAVDGPYLGVGTDEPFVAAVQRAADLGFDAKWAIHPRQITALDAAFSPTAAQLSQARNVVDALAQSHTQGRGAVELDGQMIDEALAVAARRTLARAGE